MYKIKRVVVVLVIAIALLIPGINIGNISAAALTSASISLSDSRITIGSVTYTLTFSNVTLSTIKCIKVQFSDAATGGSKPAGMTITSLALSATSTYVPTPASWTPANTDATGVSLITFGTGATPGGATGRTVVLTAITNASTAGTTYFLQFSTYNNTDCSSSPVDNATLAYIYTNGQTVTGTVDPTLTFSIAAVGSGQAVNSATTNVGTTTTTIPFGALSTATNRIAAQDLVVGTNAAGGYTVTIRYTGILTNGSGGNITDWTGPNSGPTTFSSAGTSAFGYTTDDAVLGTGTAARFVGNKWAGFTTSPLEVAYNVGATSETVRVGYQAGIAATTPSGSYTTTVIFTATPIY